MGKGIRIAKLFGINIEVDWSWLLILLLVVWNLSTTFLQVHSDWSTLFAVILGILAALLFFTSVLLHELAHSLVAKSQGLPVNKITLFLFGGVSNIREEPKSPGNEFTMAILGPVTSIVLGIVLLLLSGFGLQVQNLMQMDPMAFLQELGALRTLGVWLGTINVILGVFNLIPGFPLDGGRVLRSIIWALTDNLRQATRWASFVGQGIAWLMITGGIAMIFGIRIPFFGQGFLNGVWLILIGWFLNNAAIQSYRQLVVRDVLENVPVRQMTKRNPPTVPAEITVEDLIEDHIMQRDDHAFPVLKDGTLAGIVCLDDVRKVPASQRSTKTVSDIMTPKTELVTIGPDEPANDALKEISERSIRQLVVMQDGELFGLIRRRDIVRYLQLQSDEIQGAPQQKGKI
jgi:Zn-dependent protease/CBS domain-containing protein